MKIFRKKKIIHSIDLYFSQFISKKNYIIMLVAACVSFESNNGHIFLPIEYFKKNNFFSINNKKIIKKILLILNNKKINWLLELKNHSSIGNGNIITPLVLDKEKIYLYKIWKAEKNIFKYLNKKTYFSEIEIIKASQALKNLFPNKEEYYPQKIAIALTLINDIVFILGGPGTGKTTIIIKILLILIQYKKKNIKIQLSAPTGKATSRLIEILNNNQIFYMNDVDLEKNNIFILNPITLHQLLGISKTSNKIFFNKNNPLNIDILIIDEVSMIDILMMDNIFSSVKKNTKIIFIGDYNQLSPIGIGSILKNIYNYSYFGYSSKTISILEKIIQCSNLNIKINKNNNILISDKIYILRKNYRFKKTSGIYILSNEIFKNNQKILNKLFNNLIDNVFFYEINNTIQYINMINKIIFYNEEYWNSIEKKDDIKKIIKIFQKNQILCVIKNGLFGINNINNILEQFMHTKNIIKKYFYIKKQIWYIGKPIIITKNNKYLNLSNGDIGITNLNNNKKLQVCFLKNNNKVKCIPIELLENYNTAWCITVHKSQGSEFNHTILILPNKNLEILNQETLYTAITRSKKKITIFSNKKILIASINKNKNFY
ncbi:exodeoxyribonuclease V subunit alpha [Buchnera aphidicola]|uniref:exodeoxyribonuclease V subunit alpha n=1 Tax=Buchnera aphidicola TaxID=9 RepID=UPI003463E4A7